LKKTTFKNIIELRDKISTYEKSIDISASQETQLNQFIISLNENYITSEDASNYYKKLKIKNLFKIFVGIILYLLGLYIILIPIPKELEIYTLFYFNPNDGITVSDVFALLLLFMATYIIIRPRIRMKYYE